MIPFKHAFRIDYKINAETQASIIEETIKHGYTEEAEPYWWLDARTLDSNSVEDIKKFPQRGFQLRLDPRANWHWEDNTVVPAIRPLIESVEHLFTSLTRIGVFIQKPNRKIIAHRDLIPGNEYKLLRNAHDSELGLYDGTFLGHPDLSVEPNTRHSDQKYLNLKIPVSMRVGDAGKPFIINERGEKEYLRAHDHFYFLNEYEILHGCDAVDFGRGVIFIDGMLDMKALELEPKIYFL
jgi:hypothetical protein